MESSYERTHYEASLDVRFGARFATLSARLYRRIDLFFGFIGLASGSSALAGGLGNIPTLSVLAGAVIALAAIAERLVRPVEKAIACEALAMRFGELDAESGNLDLATLDSKLRILQADQTPCFDTLLTIAYNQNLLTNGRPEWIKPESRWQRCIAFFA